MNVDARDTKTKRNIAMSQRRKREEQLENGSRDSGGKRERGGTLG